jgi:hypothetical protein
MSIKLKDVKTPRAFSSVFNSFVHKSFFGAFSDPKDYDQLKQSIYSATLSIKNDVGHIEKFLRNVGTPNDSISKRKKT